jgi:CBS domain-containing protein
MEPIVIPAARARGDLFPDAAFCPKLARFGGCSGDRAHYARPAMNVETILRAKGSAVATIRPDATVGAAVKELISRNVGALVVSEDGETVDGIISERDIVHGLADHGAGLLSLNVAEMMTRRVVTCELSDTVDQLMAEMTNRRIRHFPVVQDGRLCGIVSIGDVVKNRMDEVEFEARSMRSFIAGA